MSYSYLASPYTHKDPAVMHSRYEIAERAMAQLLMEGAEVYCPIAMTHHAAVKYKMPKESSWWRQHNFAMLDKASSLMVLMIPGWESSDGVQAEIAYAHFHDKPVTYLIEVNGDWKPRTQE